MNHKKASATIIVLVLGIVFLLYAFSAYSDILNLESISKQYEKSITDMYDRMYTIQEGLL